MFARAFVQKFRYNSMWQLHLQHAGLPMFCSITWPETQQMTVSIYITNDHKCNYDIKTFIKLLPIHHPCKAWLYPGHPGWVEERATKPGIKVVFPDLSWSFIGRPFMPICPPLPLIGERMLSYFITISLVEVDSLIVPLTLKLLQIRVQRAALHLFQIYGSDGLTSCSLSCKWNSFTTLSNWASIQQHGAIRYDASAAVLMVQRRQCLATLWSRMHDNSWTSLMRSKMHLWLRVLIQDWHVHKGWHIVLLAPTVFTVPKVP